MRPVLRQAQDGRRLWLAWTTYSSRPLQHHDERVEPWLVSCKCNSEFEIEAEPDRLRRGVEVGRTAAERAGRRRHRVEAVIEVFDPGRQIRREHVLDAAAGYPAGVRVRETGAGRGRIVDVGPGGAG